MMKKKVESFGVVDEVVVIPMEMKEEEDEGRLEKLWWPEEVRWSPRERRKKRLEVRVLVK